MVKRVIFFFFTPGLHSTPHPLSTQRVTDPIKDPYSSHVRDTLRGVGALRQAARENKFLPLGKAGPGEEGLAASPPPPLREPSLNPTAFTLSAERQQLRGPRGRQGRRASLRSGTAVEGQLPRHFAPSPVPPARSSAPDELHPFRSPAPWRPSAAPSVPTRCPPTARPPLGPLRSSPRWPLQHADWLPVVSDLKYTKATGDSRDSVLGPPPQSNQVASTEPNMNLAYGRASLRRGP